MVDRQEEDVRNLTAAIAVLASKVDTLIAMNRDIIRWLLIVVCVIALGRSAIDLGKAFFLNFSNNSTVISSD